MDSRKALFALLAGAALTTVIGILLTPYKDSFRRKTIADKGKDSPDAAEGLIKESVTNGKAQIRKMDEDADRMVNEGGKVV
ncbi:hypothetical protein NC796_24550 [Aliifodinibius sp. S!AR15-10]|uniref:hypothetical protein n=1 Tax=Aliifodinibius sp. S!AR15-10 TaxID=2950437 RepID=UPI00285853BE|nr:hypothetical protein [Aliifodinibius sp. S!AR15-10]MDR8394342.1 hypothetical protein [Aliifodinibius sp. S!AR15-10]